MFAIGAGVCVDEALVRAGSYHAGPEAGVAIDSGVAVVLLVLLPVATSERK